MAHIHRLHCVHLNVDFETSPKILKLRSNVVFKKISDSVELHNVSGLTLQPEFVKFNEQIAVKVMEIFHGWFVRIYVEHVGLYSAVVE